MAFIENTARQIWEKYGKEVSEHMFLFPSRRSMLYFKRSMTKAASQNLWMPECLTLDQWIQDQSDFVLADTITCSYELFLSALEVGFTNSDFESFYPLARIILNDFEEVDMALIDPRTMWQHTSAWQTIANQNGPPDIWNQMKDSSLKKRWVLNWNKLDGLYKEFYRRMTRNNLATKGFLCRDVIQKLDIVSLQNYSNIHVVGFSHLTNAEVAVLEYFKSKYTTFFYWNILPELKLTSLDAGKNVLKWAAHFEQDLRNVPSDQPEVEVISTNGMAAQIKTISQLLGDTKGDEDKMAVLLPHPSLIDMFLTSFPDNRSKLNISLGYPLVYSGARSLVMWILSLWESTKNNGGAMERNDLIRIWSHQYVANYFDSKKLEIPDSAKLYYSTADLKGIHHGMDLLYPPLNSPHEALDRLVILLEELTPYQSDVFHREVLRYIVGRLVRLSDVLSRLEGISLIFLKRIILEIMQSASVPFRGEPMEGVQVLGVQEIQNLSFDTLIIPGMNEEVLPSGKLKSLIPFSLRRHYGLGDLRDMHTIQSYYIWSALLQARKVYLLHSQGDDMLGAKGLSRYIFQLKYGSEHVKPVDRYLDLALTGFDQQAKEILMNKTEERMLHKYLQEKGLSPTALMSYVTCPFQFFLRYILRIREEDKTEVGLDFRQMGTVIHDVMHSIYNPYIDRELSAEDMNEIKTRIGPTVRLHYQNIYPDDAPESLLQGQHWLEQEIIIRAVRRFVDYDEGLDRIKIRLLEADLVQSISTNYIKNVKLYGKIDRLDEIQRHYRIIDYKTGASNLSSKYDLLKLWENRNPAHNWQLMFYAYLIKDRLGSASFEVGHYTLKDKNVYVPLYSNNKIVHSSAELAQFEEILKQIIDEMVNPEHPFVQTDAVKHCEYCVYNTFCERQGST